MTKRSTKQQEKARRAAEKKLSSIAGSRMIADLKKSGYQVNRYLGGGAFGSTFSISRLGSLSNRKALKVIVKPNKKTEKEFRQEIRAEVFLQAKFAKTKQAPCVESLTFMTKGRSYLAVIKMGMIDGILSSLLWEKAEGESRQAALKIAAAQTLSWVKKLLPVLRKHNLVHGDLHWDNIGYVHVIKGDRFMIQPVLIDFGQSSVSKGGNSRLEVLQLLRTCRRDFYKHADRKVIQWMADSLAKTFKGILRVPNRFDAIDSKHNQVWHDHMDQRDRFMKRSEEAIKNMTIPGCDDSYIDVEM